MLPGIRQATNDSIFANGSNIHLTDVVAPLSCNVSASLGSLFRIQLQSSKFMIGHFLCICSECRVFILFAGIYCQHDLQGVLHVLHVFFTNVLRSACTEHAFQTTLVCGVQYLW